MPQEEGDTTFYSPNVPLDEGREIADASIDGSTNEYSFFDEALIFVRAGSGGQGSSTYKKMANGQNGLPDGGNGGKGGDVVLVADESLNTLAGLTSAWRPNSFGGSGAATTSFAPRPKSFRAENGQDGSRQFKNGRYGEDVTIRVPVGTVIQQNIELHDGKIKVVDVGSIDSSSDSIVVALGGEGGEGSGVQGKGRGVKRPRKSPEGGERKQIVLTLKLVADVAIVAVPNAGKSTLLAAVTRAKPKIANYPFTTVVPNLGVWIPREDTAQLKGSGSDGLVLCDVPGLISGAAKGIGLGHAFLRHVERCHVILHLIDATSNDPLGDFEMLNRELVNYGTGHLANMPQVVVVNKIDAFEGGGEAWEEGLKLRWTKEELENKLKQVMPHTRLMWMSAKQLDGVDDLMTRLASFVKKVKAAA